MPVMRRRRMNHSSDVLGARDQSRVVARFRVGAQTVGAIRATCRKLEEWSDNDPTT